MNTLKCLIWIAAGAVFASGCGGEASTAAGGSGGSSGSGGSVRGLVVETAQGPVEGVEQEGVHIFRGVPYAAPPQGALRWKPPEPALERDALLDASLPGKACVQTLPILGVTGDEDCLVLNVATPATGEDLPVMVWIHGGGFTLGEGAQTDGGTLGDKIAREAGVIVVTFNYRLGPFGFLAHSSLTDESSVAASGNYGLMDQTAALEWVRDNVAGFGGDPSNVTIFGESAGGFSVCSHLTSPLSAGLFHKAIIQSGNCIRPWPSLAGAEAQGNTFAEKLGCAEANDVLACMREKSQIDVLSAFPSGENFGATDLDGDGASWWPVLDGQFLTGQSAELMASGDFNQVPVMLGFTRDEGQLFTWLAETDSENPTPITDENYDDFLSHLLGGDADLATEARAQYPPEAYAAPAQALGAFMTDVTFRCPSRDEAALLAEHVTTYLYQFEYTEAAFQLDAFTPRPEYGLGAFHSAEIQYVFGRPSSITAQDFEPGVDRDLWLAMMGYWARFAAGGNPNGSEAPMWTAWTADGDDHLVLDATISPGTGAAADECAFWEDKDYLFTLF